MKNRGNIHSDFREDGAPHGLQDHLYGEQPVEKPQGSETEGQKAKRGNGESSLGSGIKISLVLVILTILIVVLSSLSH